MKTRASNADKHPGRIIVQDRQIRRSSAQVAQDEQQKAAARRQAQQTRQEAIKKIAHLQNQSQKKDTDEQTARTLPPQLAHKSVSDVRTALAGSAAKPGEYNGPN